MTITKRSPNTQLELSQDFARLEQKLQTHSADLGQFEGHLLRLNTPSRINARAATIARQTL